MKPIALLAALLLSAAVLAGCSSSPSSSAESSSKSKAESTPTPTIDPGPVELTAETAADRYLKLVCPNNFAVSELAAAFDAGATVYEAGDTPDLAPVQAAATKRIELNRATIALLDDKYFLWPDGVQDQISHIRSSYMAELATLDTMANATSFEDAYYAKWPEATAEQAAAGQEIRYQLSLEADTTASCAGFENGIQQLTEERSDREAALEV